MTGIEENTPLRHEIASGRPVLAWTGGGNVAAVIEAARVAGRLDDLRVAHADPRPVQLQAGPWMRRVPEIEASNRTGRHLPNAFRDVPDLETDGMPWHRAIVVLGVNQRPGMLDWVSGYGEAMARRVARAGGAPLAMFGDEGHARMAARRERRPGEDGPTHVFDMPGTGKRMVLYGSEEAVERARDGGPEAWTAAWDGFRGTLRVHRGDGISGLISDDRLVMAALRPRLPSQEGEVPPGLSVFEVDAKGWVGMVRIGCADASQERLDAKALAVWTGGLGAGLAWHWRNPDGAKQSPMILDAASALASLYGKDPREAEGPNLETLRRIVGSRIDVPLLHAIGRAEYPEAILAQVRADPAGRSRRRDFCLTWPGFSDLMLDGATRYVVDAGLPTLPFLADTTGIAPAVLRRLVGRAPLPPLARPLLSEPDELGRDAVHRYAPADLFGAIGHDRLPPKGDKAGWTGFLRCAKAVAMIYRRGGVVARRVPTAEAVGLMLGGPKGSTWADRGKVALEPEDFRALGDVGDVIHSLAHWIDEIGHGIEDRSLAFRILARHGSFPRLIEASRRWHDTPALAADAHRLPRSASWPVPFDPVDLGDGWSARAIGSVQGLVDEGAHGPDADGIMGLRHCVGSYAARAFTGDCLIVSMRRTTPEGIVRASTAELVPAGTGDWVVGHRSYALAQHRAWRNGRPEPETIGRFDGLRTRLIAGEIPIDAQALEPRSIGRRDVPAADRTGTLHAAWRPILPESLRDGTLDDLLRLARTLSDEIEPHDRALERQDLVRAQARR